MSGVTEETLKKRTKQFALRVINLCEALPATRVGNVMANQLIRAGTAVGANYRAACRARSPRDVVNKMGITIEETDESSYWIELIIEAKLMSEARVIELLKESDELTAIFNASHKTANANLRRANRKSKVESQK